jgi:hypothetical protein
MGPFNEMKQLQRIETVRDLLSNPDLSDWARQHWTNVLEGIARSEERYNARVAGVYRQMKRCRDYYATTVK